MQNRWCILFPLVQSYQLHWFFYSLLLLLLQISSGDERLHFIRSVKEDQRAVLYIHTYVLNFRYPADSSIPPPHLLLDCVWNGAKIGLPFQCNKKKPTTSSSAMETTTTRLNMGEWFFYRQTMSVSERMISTDRITIQFPTYGNKKMHSTFPFKLHRMALKNLYLMAASRKKKKTVPSQKVNPPRLNLTLKFLPKS